MKKREVWGSLLLSVVFGIMFFYKTVFFGRIPFPADLLLGEYKPWRTSSYFGYNPGSIPHKAQYPDTIRQLYPWRTLAMEELKNGRLPLWNPYNFSGAPLLANFQSAALYPLNIVFFVFSAPVAWTILVILQPVLAMWFTYLFARTIALSPLGALFAGVSYAYGSFSSVWLEYNTIGHVAAWLPLLLLSIEKLTQKPSRLWGGIYIIALTASFLAGHPQVAGYMLLAVLAYGVYRFRTRKKTPRVLFITLFSLGIAAVQIVPGVELILHAARAPHTFQILMQKILIQPWQVLMLVFPDIFGNPATRTYWPSDTYVGKVTSIGLLPLFFLPAALRGAKTVPLPFFFWLAGIVLLLVTASPFTALLYRLPIPFLLTSSPTLMVFLFSFALSLVCGFGVHQWIIEKHTVKKLKSRLLIVFLSLALLWLGTQIARGTLSPDWFTKIAIAKRALLYATILTVGLSVFFTLGVLRLKLIPVAIASILLLHTADLWVSFRKFNPFVPVRYVFPQHQLFSWLAQNAGINRFWGYGNAAIEANFASLFRLFSPDGYDPLYPRRYGELISLSKTGTIQTTFTTTTRSDATIAAGYGETDLSENTYRLRTLDVLGVRYVLDRAENASTDKTFPPSRFDLAAEIDGWKIFKNTQAADRVTLVTHAEQFQGPTDFAQRFFSSSFSPKKAVLLEELPDNRGGALAQGSVSLRTYLPTKVVADVETNQSSLFVLSDTYYPGWKVTVDGKLSKIYRANYAFRAVVVPEGTHAVTFLYKPLSVTLGAAITVGSILVTLVVLTKRRLWNA